MIAKVTAGGHFIRTVHSSEKGTLIGWLEIAQSHESQTSVLGDEEGGAEYSLTNPT